ncbi:hypothetical protein HHK36_028309 [Tetracentron sinense]|uniref:glutathione transferase n=1 Tax=Tetracentron sinense TaxID=13715 RepID=A0A835D2D4_TETSI|nr:hypothetical protein HHK36_028309 [Tetracentron sinense]
MANEEVKLFRTWSSPFGLRIVWALKLKGIEYETVLEDLSNKSHLLLQYNPIHKKIPVLLHNGKPIVESLVILEYIDNTWEQIPILPQDPYERARARFLAKFGDEKLLSSIWSVFVKQGKEQEEAIGSAWENLKILEEELKGKKFFGGDTIGFVDIALGWTVNLIGILEEIIELKIVDEEKFPLLCAWMQDFADVSIIKDNWPPHDKMIAKFLAIREPYLAGSK